LIELAAKMLSIILVASPSLVAPSRAGSIVMLEPTSTLIGAQGTPGGLEFAKTLPGVTLPFGYFDPLGFLEDCAQEEILRYRESELAHGRVAMMGTLGCLVQEKFHPMFAVDGPAARQLDLVLQSDGGAKGSLVLLVAIFWSEIRRARLGWEMPEVKLWWLKEGYEPGNLSFDPLGLKPKDAAGLLEMQNKELNNGRLAMIAMAGIITQEVVTGKAVL